MELPGPSVRLHSVTRQITSPTSGETTTATYYKGDPEFDTYKQESAAVKEKARLMFEHENGLPRNFLMFGEGTTFSALQLSIQIANAFEGFHRGTLDEKALEQTLSDAVADLRSSYVSKGYAPEEFMPQLIEDVYESARLNNVRGAGIASWYDSRPLAAAQNGHDRDTKDWIYYDSKYYYQAEEMKEKILEMTHRIAAKYEVDMAELDLQTTYKDGDLRKGIYSSYTSYVNFIAREQRQIGNIIDETMIPPKGLRFFYKDNSNGSNLWVPRLPAPRDEMEAAFDGVLQVWYGDWSYIGRVPVRKNRFEFPISANMFDTVFQGSKSPIPEEITNFLHNVDFFDWCVSGYYVDSHPRKI